MKLDCEVVLTMSGAPAVRDRITGEVMHPVVGPRVEAQRLYLGPSRLAERLKEGGEPLVLLDVGLGAASNALAAFALSESLPVTARKLQIVSFDHSAGGLEVALASSHRASFGLEGVALTAAQSLLDHGRYETPRTTWEFVLGDLPGSLEDAPFPPADVVFWDPFSPRANPRLWSYGALAVLFRRCGSGATVHTYSGATAVRSAFLLAGFAVGMGEPIGKGKNGTCAAVDARDLESPFDARWFERLKRSSAPFPPDAPADALARIGAMPQFAA